MSLKISFLATPAKTKKKKKKRSQSNAFRSIWKVFGVEIQRINNNQIPIKSQSFDLWVNV